MQGFVATTPKITEPIKLHENNYEGCEVKIFYPEFVIIMSPCCSIKGGMICLAPLIKVDRNFYHNSYLSEDPTRVNRKMYPRQAWGEEKWELLPEAKKRDEELKGLSYAYLSYFVYDRHTILPKYNLTEKIETDYYMIDFRTVYSLNCNKIIKADKAPIETKRLQLSVQTRTEFRDKISYYFGRTPDEDIDID